MNPWRCASISEQIAFLRTQDKRNARSLLGHTEYRTDLRARAIQARTVSILRKRTLALPQPVKAFPADKFTDLLLTGFAKRQAAGHLYQRYNIRDILITLLLEGGGLRVSEPFHLYLSDVLIDPHNPRSAQVRLYHPEQGAAPSDYIDPITKRKPAADREEYLRVRWHRLPRNLEEGRFKANWKDLQLVDNKEKYALVFWFPCSAPGSLDTSCNARC